MYKKFLLSMILFSQILPVGKLTVSKPAKKNKTFPIPEGTNNLCFNILNHDYELFKSLLEKPSSKELITSCNIDNKDTIDYLINSSAMLNAIINDPHFKKLTMITKHILNKIEDFPDDKIKQFLIKFIKNAAIKTNNHDLYKPLEERLNKIISIFNTENKNKVNKFIVSCSGFIQITDHKLIENIFDYRKTSLIKFIKKYNLYDFKNLKNPDDIRYYELITTCNLI